MISLENLEKEIQEIKIRNNKVEADKAWETSLTRRILILALTYVVVVLFFLFARLPQPFINAIVPAVGFLVSTLTISFAKKIWVKRRSQ